MGLVKARRLAAQKPCLTGNAAVRGLAAVAVLLGIVAIAVSVDRTGKRSPAANLEIAETAEVQGETQELLVTGYCNCGKCCGWRKRWFLFGRPVYSYGNMKGLPKKVGVTASGKIAAKGTIAADPSVFSFGTKMAIPGYGPGIVQDIGGSVKGAHIDVWFPSHEEAVAWGTRKIKVKVARASAEPKSTACLPASAR